MTINEEVEEAARRLEALTQRRSKLRQENLEAYKTHRPAAVYTYEVVALKRFGDFTGAFNCNRHVPPDTEVLFLTRRTANAEAIQNCARKYGQPVPLFEHERSAGYYVFAGVLCHISGGYSFFDAPQRITPEEWARMRVGDISIEMQQRL